MGNCSDHHQLLHYVKENNTTKINNLLNNKIGLLHLEYKEYGLTILEMACFVHADDVKSETIEALLKLGADPTKTFERYDYQSCLHLAALGLNSELLEIIASNQKENINSTAGGQSALIILIIDGDTENKMSKCEECVQVLLNNGIDIHQTDDKNHTALYFAAKKNYTEIVNLILKNDKKVTEIEAAELRKLNPVPLHIIDNSIRIHTGLDFLKLGNESAFIEWFNEDSQRNNAEENKLEKSLEKLYLQFACQHHLLNVVHYLKGIDPNKVGIRNTTHPLIIAIKNGYYQIVECLINAPNIEINSNVLNEALKRVEWDGGGRSNYQKTYELILSIKSLNVNPKDPLTGNCPLHFAVKYGYKPIVRDLLRRKASLANRDNRNLLAVTDIDHDTLKEHFDSCVKAEKNNEKITYLTFNYTSLIPTINPIRRERTAQGDISNQMPLGSQETDVVLYMAKTPELKPLLKHPLIESFLYLKWHCLCTWFFLNLIIQFIFCVLLFGIILFYSGKLDVVSDVHYILLFITTLSILFREIFKVLSISINKWKDFEYRKNFVCITQLIVMGLWFFKIQGEPMVAVAILLAAFEMLSILSSAPFCSIYIAMLRKVSFDFLKLFSYTSILVTAFAFAFHILFSQSKIFSNLLLALFKTVIMMTGEYETGNLKFDQFPVYSHSILLMFVLVCGVVIFNLLIGLAVSDIQEIKNEAKLVALTAQAQYVSYIESLVYDDKAVPPNCRNILLLPSNWIKKCMKFILKKSRLTTKLEELIKDLESTPIVYELKVNLKQEEKKCCQCLHRVGKLNEKIIKAAELIVREQPRQGITDCDKFKMLYELILELHEQIKNK